MDAVTQSVITKTLDGLHMRQMYSAQNIANANVSGYRPVKVTFEESLNVAATKNASAVEDVSIKVSYQNNAEVSAENRVDLELATSNQTSMRYGALLELLDRQMKLMRTAVRGGQ